MRFTWTLLVGLIGCGAEPPGVSVVDASIDAPEVNLAEDVAPAAPCSLGGTGRLRVAVTLDPQLVRRAPEVWLSTRCGEDDRELRLVRWDRSPTMVLDGFGPGQYSVVASSFVAPSARTARTVLDPRSTASLSVTLLDEPAAIGIVRAGAGVSGAVDAGARRDGAVATSDGGARPSWIARASVDAPAGTNAVGGVDVEGVQVAEDAIELRVVVRNVCAATASACPVIELAGAEARSLVNNAPVGQIEGRFDRPRLFGGESATLLRPLALRGLLPSERSAVHVAVHGLIRALGQAGSRP